MADPGTDIEGLYEQALEAHKEVGRLQAAYDAAAEARGLAFVKLERAGEGPTDIASRLRVAKQSVFRVMKRWKETH